MSDTISIEYIDMGDKDDPNSQAHPDYDGGIRITIHPRAMVLMFPSGKFMSSEDQDMMESLLNLVYNQGKEVGQNMIKQIIEES